MTNHIDNNKNLLVIIARYNEEIEWLNDFKYDVIIYNKGDEISTNHKVINIPNFGRESETYVRAIIENYDNLCDYKYICFLQGNPFDHCSGIKQYLEELNNVIESKRAKQSYYTFGYYQDYCIQFKNEDFIFNTHKHVIDLIWEKLYKNSSTILGVSEIENKEFIPKFDTKQKLINYLGDELDYTLENEYIIYMHDILKLNNLPEKYNFVWGAQYAVDTMFLKNKSLDWWKNLYTFIEYTCLDSNLNLTAYILERIWPLIWLHSDKVSKEC